ncbi:MAG: PCRF domain-containing protein, partial [Candidatus Saccharibacteria bacterium]|nr:PCRF domain-containing protein [Candidatus Saccharibacteria bacterium]
HQNLKQTIISQSFGDEAGLKSLSLQLESKPFLYGLLKGEHGVHRLVRLSPFNSKNLRQTSFAKLEIIPILEASEDLDLKDGDLKVDTYRSSGPGGQGVNKTDSAVRITHLPTGLSVTIQNTRSQNQNKQLALNILKSKLLKLQSDQKARDIADLKGETSANEWGSQIRNYVLHPYKQVKDLRTQHATTDVEKVLNGQFDDFLQAYLDYASKISYNE